MQRLIPGSGVHRSYLLQNRVMNATLQPTDRFRFSELTNENSRAIFAFLAGLDVLPPELKEWYDAGMDKKTAVALIEADIKPLPAEALHKGVVWLPRKAAILAACWRAARAFKREYHGLYTCLSAAMSKDGKMMYMTRPSAFQNGRDSRTA